jgi:hypothetical protein
MERKIDVLARQNDLIDEPVQQGVLAVQDDRHAVTHWEVMQQDAP